MSTIVEIRVFNALKTFLRRRKSSVGFVDADKPRFTQALSRHLGPMFREEDNRQELFGRRKESSEQSLLKENRGLEVLGVQAASALR